VLLESVGQPVVFVHPSHVSIAIRHGSDERSEADVTGRSAAVDSVSPGMVRNSGSAKTREDP